PISTTVLPGGSAPAASNSTAAWSRLSQPGIRSAPAQTDANSGRVSSTTTVLPLGWLAARIGVIGGRMGHRDAAPSAHDTAPAARRRTRLLVGLWPLFLAVVVLAPLLGRGGYPLARDLVFVP